MLTGLSIDGSLVTDNRSSIDRDLLCDHLLRQVPPAKACRRDHIKLTWMNANFNTPSRCDNKSTDCVCSGIYITHV